MRGRIRPLGQHVVRELGDVVRHVRRLAGGARRPVGLDDVAGGQAGQRQADAHIDVGQGAADGVAAFEHGDVGGKASVEGRIALGRELLVGQRVGEVVVLACGVDDQIRLEVPQDGQDHALQDVEVAFVRGAWRKRNVDRAPKGCRPAVLAEEARAGIERPAVLVQGDEEGVGIVPEDVLAAVGVVHVGVHDGDAQGASARPLVAVADPGEHDGFVVDVAEAAVAVDDAHGVVARRPHQGEGPLFASLEHEPGRRDGTAGRGQVRIGDDGLNAGQAEVHALYVVVAAQARAVLGDALDVEEALLFQLVAGVEQALLPLGMRRGDGPVEGREEHDAQRSGGFREELLVHMSPPWRLRANPSGSLALAGNAEPCAYS